MLQTGSWKIKGAFCVQTTGCTEGLLIYNSVSQCCFILPSSGTHRTDTYSAQSVECSLLITLSKSSSVKSLSFCRISCSRALTRCWQLLRESLSLSSSPFMLALFTICTRMGVSSPSRASKPCSHQHTDRMKWSSVICFGNIFNAKWGFDNLSKVWPMRYLTTSMSCCPET